VLLECGLLDGALSRNRDKKFICRQPHVKVENNTTMFTSRYDEGEVITLPVAHGEGNYYAPPETIDRLEENSQIVFRYSDADGKITEDANLNGSVSSIAGISNKGGNVLGLMPHPERASDLLLGSDDGARMFEGLVGHVLG